MTNPMHDADTLLAWSASLEKERLTFHDFCQRQLRDDVLHVLEVTQDPTEVGIELMVRTLTEADFDRLIASHA